MVPRMNFPKVVRALRARPLAALAALLALATAGNALLVGCGGKSQQSAQSEAPASAPSSAPASTSGSPAGDDLGAQVYAQRCVLCHGPLGKGDGVGAAGLDPKPRNHTDGAYMNSRTNEQLLEVIHNGKGQMPAWGNVLSEAEIHAVLKHVRSLAQPAYAGPTP